MRISVDEIEALRRVRAELPRYQPKTVSKQEAIALLASELGAAQRRGYKAEDLVQLFAERGIDINAATVQGYLRRTRKVRKRGGGKAAVTAGGHAATATAAAWATRTAVPVAQVARAVGVAGLSSSPAPPPSGTRGRGA